MSKRVDGVIIICDEPERHCELCGVWEECRPYGPKGEQICFACGEKDPETTTKMMGQVLFGDLAVDEKETRH